MSVDKWAQCGQFLLINGPSAIIVLYWASDGSCDYVVVQAGFRIEVPVQRRLCPIFVKLWISNFGASQLGIRA